MRAYIFQSMPDRFDLSVKLSPQSADAWYATRYRTKMNPGDIVFFWMGGDPKFRGLYGWGTIQSLPYFKKEWNAWAVDIKYDVKFANHIRYEVLLKDHILREMLIFRVKIGTNFLLDDKQLKSLIGLISNMNQTIPNIYQNGN
ncbi:MAG: hypothetical protein DRJ15_16020 [Bacteroidetes bacterium]|nr:MAG: hypothetical protein DRJ15_16020 [Bacteroidota bacterium]